MKKLDFNNLDQELYYFRLKNGLKVFLVPFPLKKNFYVVLGTKYGSRDIEFEVSNQKIKTPHGTAHFLEHKMFENEDDVDPFEFFSKSGVSTNASTTFDNTRYYFWGVNDLEKNLSYLLDFVYTPYFTDVNVEKEKGIIKEEILMYDDDPEWVLDDTMRKNLFYHLPIREKIAGTVESIMKISVSDLKQAYDAFYHPSNMFLVIGGNFKPECLEKLIKSHKRLNEFKGLKNIQRIYYDEPDDVCCEFKKINMDIEIPKIRFSIKINKNRFSSFDDIELSMYFGILMTVLFGQTSDFKEKVINEQLTTGFYVEKNNFDDFITIDITAESDKADMFIDEVKNTLEDFSITKKDLERIKKVWIASEIRMIDNIEMTVDNICSDLILYDRVYTNRIEKIKKLNSRKLEKFIDELDLSNQSLVMILPKK